MCKFFSFCSNGNGEYYYFDWNLRQSLKYSNLEFDSHSSIATHFKFNGANKFEYNPFLKTFKVDQINLPKDDSKKAEKWARSINFKDIIGVIKWELVEDVLKNPLEIEFKGDLARDFR